MSGQKIDIYQILWQHRVATLFLKALWKLSMDWIQMPQPCTVISRRQFNIKQWVLRNSGTLLIDPTIKFSSGFESANPGLVIGKGLINPLLIHYNKVKYKIFKI